MKSLLVILALPLLLIGGCASTTPIEDGPCEIAYADQSGDKGIYKGICKNGRPNGKGEVIYTKGDQFSGFFKDGLRNGYGEYTWASGTNYRGEYLYDNRHGTGTITWVSGQWNGESYSGGWVRGMRQGQGEYKDKDGNIFRGEFKMNNFIRGEWIKPSVEICLVPAECEPPSKND